MAKNLSVLAGALLLATNLAACATVTAVQTGKPIDPVQVQQDLAVARQALQLSGCAVATFGAAAAPIIAVAADAQGNKMLTAVSATGAAVCTVPAPSGLVSGPGTVLGTTAAVATPSP